MVDCFFYSYIIYVCLSYFLNVLLRRLILLMYLLVMAQSFYSHFCSCSLQPAFAHTALFVLPKYKTLGRIKTTNRNPYTSKYRFVKLTFSKKLLIHVKPRKNSGDFLDVSCITFLTNQNTKASQDNITNSLCVQFPAFPSTLPFASTAL